jgi:hypothetical protein
VRWVSHFSVPSTEYQDVGAFEEGQGVECGQKEAGFERAGCEVCQPFLNAFY